jgi:hypothetical protein
LQWNRLIGSRSIAGEVERLADVYRTDSGDELADLIARVARLSWRGRCAKQGA